MNYLKQALMELLSGLTAKKNEKEIWIKVTSKWDTTVEPIDDEHYIIRYYNDGRLGWEYSYKNDQLHGISKSWHEDDRLWLEYQCKNDQLHGFYKSWDKNGQLLWNELWENGNFVRKII